VFSDQPSKPVQAELLDRHDRTTREQLANAVFAYPEGFYNPRRRHCALGDLSPADRECVASTAARTGSMITPAPLTHTARGTGGIPST
jgi:hypothetical protein